MLILKTLSKQKKQVLLLYSTTILGVIVGVFSSIINTRSLKPADYGNVRYVINIISFVSSLLLFGYFLSGSRMLALSKDEERSKSIRGVMIIILAITCIAMVVSQFICYFIYIGSNPQIADLFIVALPVCCYTLFLNYINTVFQGDNYIGRISLARFLPSLLYVIVAYFVYKNYGATAKLMIALLLGINTLVLLPIVLSAKFSFRNIKQIFKQVNKENREYGFQLYIGSLVMVASNYIAGITLGLFNKDNTEVGFYTLALSVTSPLATLPSIIGTTYFKEFASMPKIPSKVIKLSILLTSTSCLLFILLIKPIVKFLYSDAYSPVGTYAILLSIGFCIHGLGDMINRYLGSHGEGKAIRNSSIFNGIFKIFGFTVLVYLLNTLGAIITNIVCDIIYCGCLLFYYNKFTSKA